MTEKATNQETSPVHLSSQVIRGGGWLILMKISGVLFELIKALVLARLLTPQDFGLFGIVMLAIAVIEAFSQSGFHTALIQRKENTEKYLDTAWSIQVLRGFILFSILFFTAPLVSTFFKEPRIVVLLQVVSISVILRGMTNIGIVFFDKELKFHKQFIYEMTGNTASLIVGIVLAFQLRSVWALIWANIVGVTTRCILSYILHPYRPLFRLNRAQSAELFRFGRWMSGYTIVIFAWQQLDRLIIGKVLNAAALGIYQMAYRIANLAISQVSLTASTVMFPAFAKIQHEKNRLGRAFLDVFEFTVSIILPLTVFTFFAASDIVHVLLGSKWAESILPLKILSLAGFLGALENTSTPLFIGIGRPELEFWKSFSKAFIMLLTIYPLTLHWGLAGTCFSVVLGSFAPFPIWVQVRSIAMISSEDIIRKMLPGVVLGIAGFIAVLLSNILFYDSHVRALLFEGFVACILWTIATMILHYFWEIGPYIHMRKAVLALFPATKGVRSEHMVTKP